MNKAKPQKTTGKLSRRAFMIGLPVVVAGCQTEQVAPPVAAVPLIDEGFKQMYAAIDTEPFPVPAVDLSKIPSQFYRQVVQLPPGIEADPSTIVIDPPNHFLYLVFENGSAIRYGVGVGRQGFLWSGNASIQAKRQWPSWHPPKEMLARSAEAAKYPNGMPGGPTNPLGARAMYLYQGKVDTLYRIHGTPESWTIGRSISSGCIRMINQDIIDLYNRVPIGTKVRVLGDAQPDPAAVYGKSEAVPDPTPPTRTGANGAPLPPGQTSG